VSEKLLTVAEAAKILGVHRPRMYELLRLNLVPGRVQLGRQIRVNPSILRTFLDSGGRGLDEGSQNCRTRALG
jgi:excisionase family DNA binding protein